MPLRLPIATICLGAIVTIPGTAEAQDGAQNLRIKSSIDAGAAWLGDNINGPMDSGVKSLAALAMVKAEVDPSDPAIVSAVEAVLGRCSGGEYEAASQHHVYQAGVEAMLLADVHKDNPGRYQAEVAAIVRYILGQQLPNGGFDYPSGRDGKGDTSVVQYACLGLWAGERIGLEIPQSAWDGVLNWHISTQNSDGGCAYVPGGTEGYEHGGSSINMTLAGLSSTLIAVRYSFPGQADSMNQLLNIREQRTPSSGNRFGPLEAVDLTQASEPEPAEVQATGPSGTTVDIERLKNFVRRAFGFTMGRIGRTKGDLHYPVYYYYTMERMCALAGIGPNDPVGNFNWYAQCSDELINRQGANGNWDITTFQARDTAFCVLFLSLFTAHIVGTTTPINPIGGGLLKGGRLPVGADLSTIRVDSSGLLVQEKDLGPLDQMLALLSTLDGSGIDDVQRQIVEKVQIGDREALIENKERIIELVGYQNPDDPDHAAEVRRTAVWAVGRTNDLSLVTLLIRSLDDVNFSVMMEARNALCWLARRPNGLGEPNDPLETVPEDASPDQRQAAITAWHAEAFRNWGAWYLENRPYEDRGDEFEAWLLDRMSQL